MKSAIRSLLAVAVLATAPFGTAGASPASQTSYYVSVGDSMAACFEPIGRFSHGYADQLNRDVQEHIRTPPVMG